METCDKLSRVITPQDEDKSDDWFLDALWGNVYPMLARDRGIKLTTRDEFIEKAKSYPGGGFIDRVKDVANAGEKSATSWGCLFNDGMYFIFSACSALIISHI